MSTNDEQTIRGLIAEWSRALEAKDPAGLVANYAPDAVLFDAIPPYKFEGAETIRNLWEQCLPCFPDDFRSEHRDLVVHVAGDVAVAHGLHHCVTTPADHPCGQSWMRITVCFRRIDGQWKVVHEHVSVPFNPMNSRAWFIADPDALDAPDYNSDVAACSK